MRHCCSDFYPFSLDITDRADELHKNRVAVISNPGPANCTCRVHVSNKMVRVLGVLDKGATECISINNLYTCQNILYNEFSNRLKHFYNTVCICKHT